MTIGHIRLRRIRHLADTAMPQNVPGCRVEGDQVPCIVTREQQLPGSSENTAHDSKRARRIEMAPHGLAGLVVDRHKVAAQRRYCDFFLSTQTHSTAWIRLG